MTFVDFDIAIEWCHCETLYFVTLIYFCEGKKVKNNNNNSETVRASAKMCTSCFADIDICHRILSLHKLYCVTMTYF